MLHRQKRVSLTSQLCAGDNITVIVAFLQAVTTLEQVYGEHLERQARTGSVRESAANGNALL